MGHIEYRPPDADLQRVLRVFLHMDGCDLRAGRNQLLQRSQKLHIIGGSDGIRVEHLFRRLMGCYRHKASVEPAAASQQQAQCRNQRQQLSFHATPLLYNALR